MNHQNNLDLMDKRAFQIPGNIHIKVTNNSKLLLHPTPNMSLVLSRILSTEIEMNSIKAIEKPRPMAKLAEKKHVSQHQVSIVPNEKKIAG